MQLIQTFDVSTPEIRITPDGAEYRHCHPDIATIRNPEERAKVEKCSHFVFECITKNYATPVRAELQKILLTEIDLLGAPDSEAETLQQPNVLPPRIPTLPPQPQMPRIAPEMPRVAPLLPSLSDGAKVRPKVRKVEHSYNYRTKNPSTIEVLGHRVLVKHSHGQGKNGSSRSIKEGSNKIARLTKCIATLKGEITDLGLDDYELEILQPCQKYLKKVERLQYRKSPHQAWNMSSEKSSSTVSSVKDDTDDEDAIEQSPLSHKRKYQEKKAEPTDRNIDLDEVDDESSNKEQPPSKKRRDN